LALDAGSPKRELVSQTMLISGFKETGPKSPMNLKTRIDRDANDVLRERA
jgi:hypothetical protein